MKNVTIYIYIYVYIYIILNSAKIWRGIFKENYLTKKQTFYYEVAHKCNYCIQSSVFIAYSLCVEMPKYILFMHMIVSARINDYKTYILFMLIFVFPTKHCSESRLPCFEVSFVITNLATMQLY